jgi:hypothetical protein
MRGVFRGWNGDTAFDLINGEVWVQARYDYEYDYAYAPRVRVYSLSSGGYLLVVGDNTRNPLPVVPATHALRTCINGDFEGWSGDTIFPLCDGHGWIQSEYDYEYQYSYMPRVLIFSTDGAQSFRMQVEGMRRSVAVQPLW